MSDEPTAPPPLQPMQAPALPSPVEVMRGLRAPLIGLAVTFGVAIVMVVLIALASAVDSSEESGVDSSTIQAIGVLLAMPFQLVSMALLGQLHIDDSSGIGTAFFAPPLGLTAIYLYVTARTARRSVTATDDLTRGILAATIGLVTAAVITPVAWGAAMRDEGTTMHAASVSLFFGVWALTGAAAFIGSRRGAGKPRPAWISTEYAEAIRLWLHQMIVWIVIAAPLLVIAGFDKGLWLVLLIPLWVFTVGLDTYAVSHLGSVGIAGGNAYAWDFDAWWAVVMLSGAVLLTVLTATTWHLRRDQRSEWLARPESWLVVPSVFAGGGVLVWLVPRVTAGGGIGDFSASVAFGPSPLAIVFLSLFGLVVEFLSRTVAATLAGLAPAGLVARLRGAPVEQPHATSEETPGQVTGPTRPPLTDAERRQWKRIGIGVGVAVILVGGTAVTISAINSSRYSAEAEAKNYLDAVVKGDLSQALEIAPVDDEAKSDLLTGSVYKAAENKISSYEIKDTETFGNVTTVTVELKGTDGESVETDLRLKQDGKTAGIFNNWKVTDGGLAKRVTLELPDGSTGISIDGVTTEAKADGDYWLFPGTYLFNPFEGNPWLSPSGDGATTVEIDSYGGYIEIPDAEPSESFRAAVDQQLADLLKPCMAAKTVDPAGCPNRGYSMGDKARKVVWTLTTSPTIDYSSFDGTFPADLSVDSGEAALTYEYDASYGFGPQDWTRETDTASLYLSLKVNLVDDKVVAEFDTY